MSEERLKEIKDSLGINYISFGRIAGKTLISKHLQQELELYNEVIRLREENKQLRQDVKEHIKVIGEYKEENNTLKELNICVGCENQLPKYSMSDQVDY